MANENKDEIIRGHEYDGIHELDNPLPKWWLFIFYATIIFSVAYWSYYELLGGPSLKQELALDLAEIQARKDNQVQAPMETPNDVNVEALLKDQGVLEKGKAAYLQTCAACHGQNGEGGIGPNLADNYWIHSKGNLDGVLVALREGFPEKGMPAWKDIVPKEDHVPVAVFVLSLKGTNPANAKEAQGELVE